MAIETIRRSKGGINYTIGLLGESQQVSARACLWGIPHRNSGVELALKIGRYKKVTFNVFGHALEDEELDNSSPKSELTLTAAELDNLVEFLGEQTGLVRQGAGTYVPVNSDVAGLVNELCDQLATINPDELIALIQSGKFLPKEVLDIAHLRRRQDQLEVFRNLVDSNAKETLLQSWFKENEWALGSDCARILDERAVDVEHIADYIVEAYDGHADVIEIKRPGAHFWAAERDHGNLVPHMDLVKAITQAQAYQFELEREMNSIKMSERLKGVPIAKPRSILLHGRSVDWDGDHLRAQRLLNAGYTSLEIWTFDQALRRVEMQLGRTEKNRPPAG